MQTFKTFLVHFGLVLTSSRLIAANKPIFIFNLTSDMKPTDFDNPNSALGKEVKFVVRGQHHKASEYLTLTPSKDVIELGIKITNTSIFVPGDDAKNTQYGFRRTDVLPALDPKTAYVGTTVFHQSVRLDPTLPLNLTHGYLLSSIELHDGTHVYDLFTGSDFSADLKPVPTKGSGLLRVRNRNTTDIYHTKFKKHTVYNFAIEVNWDKSTLTVYASEDDKELKKVAGPSPIDHQPITPDQVKQAEWHQQLLKYPLPDSHDDHDTRNDVPHHGYQEGTTERVFFSRMYVEDASDGKPTLTTGPTSDTTSKSPSRGPHNKAIGKP